jgi:hypothetical protein
MAWHLEGTYFEQCPCDVVCPCITSAFMAPADVERCLTVLAFHIASGEIDGVDVNGLTVAMFVDSPRVMWEGNWRVGMFMDAAASQQQAGKLGALFSGKLGGPMEMLAGLTGERLGVQIAPIQYADEGRRHRIQIGELAEIEIEDFVPPQNPEGEVYRLTGILHPVNSTQNIARATTSRFSAFGQNFSHEGKYGQSAPFSWAA